MCTLVTILDIEWAGRSLTGYSLFYLACMRKTSQLHCTEDGNDDIRFDIVIEEMNALEKTPNGEASFGMSHLPVVPNGEFEVFPGVLHTREAIVEHLH